MKLLCRECHYQYGTRSCDADKADAFYSGACEYCGKYIETAIVCYGYDFRGTNGPYLVYRHVDGS